MKRIIVIIFRKLGLIGLADRLRYVLHFIKTYKSRNAFRSEHSDIPIPPPYFIYETYSLNYQKYFYDGLDTAKDLVDKFRTKIELDNSKILDWGCGPGRTIRHFPQLIPNCQIYGTDYNPKYINWCKSNLKGIDFKLNGLKPPLDFEDNFFDVIYGISIFTHLSESMHYEWAKELMRVLKPGGILYITLHGLPFREKLSDQEQKDFDNGKLVFSTKTKEGHRTFVAFQPESFVRELFSEHVISEFIPGLLISGRPDQDIWIIRKKDE